MDIYCDRCGKSLLVDELCRYVVRIEVFAAYDPMEITGADLKKDFDAEFQRLLEILEGMSPEELEDQVYKYFKFDLCMRCQKEYIRDPLCRKKETTDDASE
jgi:hypothetical protein